MGHVKVTDSLKSALGKGALTAPLLEATGKLEVIELDRDLIPGLRVQFSTTPSS
ncbi:hypothetical protein HAALTHF_22530n [Vreelandella aquamarina]|nr:hypothetical protein HAALTHF_22530n [Halomonas axialensis]